MSDSTVTPVTHHPCPLPTCQQQLPHRNSITQYIIEHLEPEIDDWIAIEYANIVRKVGPERLIITNIAETVLQQLAIHGCDLQAVGVRTYPQSLLHYAGNTEQQQFVIPPENEIALLEMRTQYQLSPADGQVLKYVILGGILGDNPPRDRAGHLRESKRFTLRHLGSKQMSVDTAAIVCSLIVDHKHELDQLPYVDNPEIKTGDSDSALFDVNQAADGTSTTMDAEHDDDAVDDFTAFADSVELPYRYLADSNGQPILPEGLHQLLVKDADLSLTDQLGENALASDIDELQAGIDQKLG